MYSKNTRKKKEKIKINILFFRLVCMWLCVNNNQFRIWKTHWIIITYRAANREKNNQSFFFLTWSKYNGNAPHKIATIITKATNWLYAAATTTTTLTKKIWFFFVCVRFLCLCFLEGNEANQIQLPLADYLRSSILFTILKTFFNYWLFLFKLLVAFFLLLNFLILENYRAEQLDLWTKINIKKTKLLISFEHWKKKKWRRTQSLRTL